MVLRKGLVFIFSSILTGMIIAAMFMPNFNDTFVFIIICTSPMILVFGIPISCFSDVILKNVQDKRRCVGSFVIHIIFGLFFGLVLSCLEEAKFLLIGPIIASVVVWVIDELLKMMFKKRKQNM